MKSIYEMQNLARRLAAYLEPGAARRPGDREDLLAWLAEMNAKLDNIEALLIANGTIKVGTHVKPDDSDDPDYLEPVF